MPNLFEQFLRRKDLVRMPHEMREQPKLNGTQVDGLPAVRYLVADGIKRDVSQFEQFAAGTLIEALKKFFEPDWKISLLGIHSDWRGLLVRKDDKWEFVPLDSVPQLACPSTLAAALAVGHDDRLEGRVLQDGPRGLARAADSGLKSRFS
jgi:hypothetical protein